MSFDCNSSGYSPISIDFQIGGELYPTNATLDHHKDKFDSFYCKFDSVTASEIKESLDNGPLNEVQSATVKIYGEPYRTMYYEPNFFKIGDPKFYENSSGYLELHDLHEQLTKGNIEWHPPSPNVETTFRKIFQSRVDDDILNTLTLGEQAQVDGSPNLITEETSGVSDEREENSLLGGTGTDETVSPREFLFKAVTLSTDFVLDNVGIEDISKKEIEDRKIEFNGITPFKALQKAKQTFSIGTYISPTGELVVGEYNHNKSMTASISGTGVDYHIESGGLGGGFERVSKIHVKGPVIRRIEEEKERGSDSTVQPSYKQITEDTAKDRRRRMDRIRMHVIVKNPNVNNGNVIVTEAGSTVFSKEQMERVGLREYWGHELQNSTGNMTINMDTSNSSYIPRIKDTITVKNAATCGDIIPSNLPSEEYFVTGVKNKYDGSLKTTVGLQALRTNINALEFETYFYNFSDDQTYTPEEIYNNTEDVVSIRG